MWPCNHAAPCSFFGSEVYMRENLQNGPEEIVFNKFYLIWYSFESQGRLFELSIFLKVFKGREDRKFHVSTNEVTLSLSMLNKELGTFKERTFSEN